jgi:sugar lactone lactonase YvrE
MNVGKSYKHRYMLIPVLSGLISVAFAAEPPGDVTADLVLGQAAFTTTASGTTATTMWLPKSVAVDRSVSPNRVYVADFLNNRVLMWNSAVALATGLAADGVVGQADLVSGSAATSATGLNRPDDIAVDSLGNLYVADRDNNRVVRFNKPFGTVDAATGAGDRTADGVFGQTNFTTSTVGHGGVDKLNAPAGLIVDSSNNLYVADTSNSRVLRYANANTVTTPGPSAVGVFGQPNFTGFGNGTSNINLITPANLVIDGANNLYVSDAGNSRVLRFANANIVTMPGPSAVGVFGQIDFTVGAANQGGTATASTLNVPTGLALDSSGRLYVSDNFNNRVLRYDAPTTITTSNPSVAATAVLGQAGSFTTTTVNNGGVSSQSLRSPVGLAFDTSGNLYVADSSNSRVLRFDAAAPPTPASHHSGGGAMNFFVLIPLVLMGFVRRRRRVA